MRFEGWRGLNIDYSGAQDFVIQVHRLYRMCYE